VVAFVEVTLALLCQLEMQIGAIHHGRAVALLGTLIVELHRFLIVLLAARVAIFEADGEVVESARARPRVRRLAEQGRALVAIARLAIELKCA